MKRKRLVIDVKPAKPDGPTYWWVEWRGFGRRELCGRKSLALILAKDQALNHVRLGGLSQIVIRNRNGDIQSERTYGDDPRRRKG